MIFVDSSVWIDYFRGASTSQTDQLDRLFGTNSIVVGDLVLTEVLQGFPDEKDFQTALGLFQTVKLIRLGGYRLAIESARNFRTLRAKGYTVRKTIDTLIATSCILNGLELLHNDRDFTAFEKYLGLRCR
jgi:predicted nucleic acid-binding protein